MKEVKAYLPAPKVLCEDECKTTAYSADDSELTVRRCKHGHFWEATPRYTAPDSTPKHTYWSRIHFIDTPILWNRARKAIDRAEFEAEFETIRRATGGGHRVTRLVPAPVSGLSGSIQAAMGDGQRMTKNQSTGEIGDTDATASAYRERVRRAAAEVDANEPDFIAGAPQRIHDDGSLCHVRITKGPAKCTRYHIGTTESITPDFDPRLTLVVSREKIEPGMTRFKFAAVDLKPEPGESASDFYKRARDIVRHKMGKYDG